MKISDAPLTFVPPARSGPVMSRVRAIKRVARVTVPRYAYLPSPMQDMAATGKQMLPEVKAMSKQVGTAKRDIRQGEARTFAPIP